MQLLRVRLVRKVLFWSLVVRPGVSARQSLAAHCDPAPLAAAAEVTRVDARVAAEAATYRNAEYEGRWIGMKSELALATRHGSVRGWLPWYQLERNGLNSAGLGDAGVSARFNALGSHDGHVRAGPWLTLTLPTGAESDHLGMGHPMLSGGVTFAGTAGPLVAGAAVGAARALTAADHAHHHGPAPLVDPMNMSEALALASVGWQIEAFRPTLGLGWAEPLDDGVRRAWTALGGSLIAGPVELELTAQIPLAGNPFRLRTVLSAAVHL